MIHNGTNGLANQPLCEPVDILDGELGHITGLLDAKLDIQWFTERVEVSIEDALEVIAKVGHVWPDSDVIASHKSKEKSKNQSLPCGHTIFIDIR